MKAPILGTWNPEIPKSMEVQSVRAATLATQAMESLSFGKEVS